MPIGLVVARKRHMEKWTRGAHGNTYGGNPLCCAAALATIDLVHNEYQHNADTVGTYLLERLREMWTRFDCIGEVRGKGLFIGVELVESRACKTPAVTLCQRVLERGFHNGIVLLSCGRSTLRLMPPLMIDRATADEALALIEGSIGEALEG